MNDNAYIQERGIAKQRALSHAHQEPLLTGGGSATTTHI